MVQRSDDPLNASASAKAETAGERRRADRRATARRTLELDAKIVQQAVRLAQIGFFDWDLVTGERTWSREVFEILGRDPADPESTAAMFLKALHPDDATRVLAAFSDMTQGAGAPVLEFRIVQPNGATRDVLSHWEVTSEGGQAVRLAGTLHDITPQRRAEQERRERDAELREAQRLANIGNWTQDIASGHLTWSEELYAIFGLPPAQEAPGLDGHARLMTPESFAELRAATVACIKHGRPFEVTINAIRADGTPRTLIVRGEAVRTVDGRTVRLRGTTQDVTAQRAAQRELDAVNDRLQDVIGAFPGMMFQWLESPEKRGFIWTNEQARAVVGRTPDELTADWRAVGLDPAAYEAFDQSIRDAIADMSDWQLIGPINHPEKGLRFMRGTSRPRRLADGAVLFTGVLVDVTETYEAEQKALESQHWLYVTQEAIGFGVWDYDSRSDTTVWSDGFYRLWGYEPGEVAPTFANQIIRVIAEDREALTRNYQSVVSWGRVESIEFRIRLPDGRERWLAAHTRVFRNEDGTISRLSGINIDVTDLKTAEAGLRQTESQLIAALEMAHAASRAKSEFLARMSHELRTPLNAVIGFAGMIANRVGGGPVGERYLAYAGDIERAARHLLSLVEDILHVNQVDAGRIQLDESEFLLAATAEEALNGLTPLFAEKGLKPHITASDGRKLRGDERRLRQIILNLLSNAVKFTPPGGQVSVVIEAGPGGSQCLRVIDTGLGIDPDQLPHLGEPFPSAPAYHRREGQGAGLGLAICRQIADLHGATLAIRSERGKGTEVELVLPPGRVG